MQLIDISPTISAEIGVWPGDVPYTGKKTLQIADGANLDLGSMETTFHVGAHIDATNHFVAGGADAASMPLAHFYGPCQVIEVNVRRGQRIHSDDVREPIKAPRVLLKTGTFPDANAWNNDFAALSAELVEWLAEQKVRLVGIDTPSIDLFDDKELEAHQAIGRNQMANLEGIVLADVAPGDYTLIAMPLKLKDADASPVRAVLIQE